MTKKVARGRGSRSWTGPAPLSWPWPGFDFKALQLQLKAKLGTKCVIPFTETLPELRLREYLKYGNEFRNDQIRGRVTAVAERAVMQTLRGDFATVVPRRITGRGTLRQRSIVRSISFGFGTHFATDVPKHWLSEQVWALINDLRSEAGFKGQDDRSSLI
jgi:hypothetical protein